eukprot:TRINITY_DN2806_c2_g2_i2.p1 TRINITY_DN2806_c2_g2~~TRINITY_DN2806_c2_g2_i2.p1  ORF type:complete len:445 (+),score=91.07 TRINITY_DN2806_c2_g2_i2:156-1337(+)
MKNNELVDCMKMSREDLLIRFFIGRNFKIKPAVESMTKNQQWRKDKQVDDIFKVTEKKIPKDIIFQSHVDGLCGFYGFDIEGYPVYWEKPNGKGLNKIVHDLHKDDLFDWHIAAVERGREITKYLNVDRITMVMDLSALGARALMFGKVSSMLNDQMKYDQENYPECMRKMFIINAPFGFSSAYTAIKVFLDARVQEKITICSSRHEGDAMSKWIPPNQTPTEFGGTADVDWDASRLQVTGDVNIFENVKTYTEAMKKVANGRGKSDEKTEQENSEQATQPDQEKEKEKSTHHHHHHHGSGKHHHHHGGGHHHHHHGNGDVNHDDLLFTCISFDSLSDSEGGSPKSPSPNTTPRGMNRSGRKHSLVRNDSLRNTGRDDQDSESSNTRCCCVVS